MCWELAANMATALGAPAIIVAGIFALCTYRNANRTRRAEWLSSLHEQFFENNRYNKVRVVLDYQPDPAYSELIRDIQSEQPSEMTDELYRYLNFFEMLASLKELKQLSNKEIVALFEYDLRTIYNNHHIMSILRSQSFESLCRLLSELKDRK